MKNNNQKILLALGFNKKEIAILKINTNIEELVVLLSSLHIKNIKKYILRNEYLLTCNIYDLSSIISNTFNKNKSYCKVKRILTKNKYAIINEKGDVK